MTDWRASIEPIYHLTLTRIREFVREPEAVFWVFVFPIILAFALGIAFRSRGAEVVHVGIQGGVGAATLMEALAAAPDVEPRLVAPLQADAALRNGEVQLVVVPGTPPVYRFDPTRTESRLARLVVDEVLQRASGRVETWRAIERPTLARGSRYIDWLIPGLLGMNIMGTGLWGIGFSIVQARNRKLLKQLIATPMRRRDYLLAQMLGRLVFLTFEVAALLLFARLMFDVPIAGSPATLALVALVGAMSFAGLGLLVASRPRTVEGVSGLLNFVMLPMWILSGVFFASTNFPAGIQPLIQILPLTALNDAFRAVMLEGASLLSLTSELTILVVWGAVGFAVALRVFRWQ